MKKSSKSLSLLTVCAAALLLESQPAFADELYYPTTPNGYRIYMSPARHSDAGARGECRAYNENTMAYANAYDASASSKWPTSTLIGRGYTVRLGTQTLQDAINNSNAWGADRHVALHSNAKPTGCPSGTAATNGTWVFHYHSSTTGRSLANSLLSALRAYSPGTGDRICIDPNDGCADFSLGELRLTSAPAAYIEAEFHTWEPGVDWIWWDTSWQWRMAEGIDAHLGRPR